MWSAASSFLMLDVKLPISAASVSMELASLGACGGSATASAVETARAHNLEVISELKTGGLCLELGKALGDCRGKANLSILEANEDVIVLCERIFAALASNDMCRTVTFDPASPPGMKTRRNLDLQGCSIAQRS